MAHATGPRSGSRRVLFLDDDPDRASRFLATHPSAVWVESADRCIALLRERWDEVCLDHDLSGETFVDMDRDDCGMAVVRWLCDEPRPHLSDTRFVIHTHNPLAACVMLLHLRQSGFRAEAIPFTTKLLDVDPAKSRGRLFRRIGRLFGKCS